MRIQEPTNKNRSRLVFLFGIACLLFVLLALRLGWHQIIRAQEYAQRATDQQTSDSTVQAVRGSIKDRNGRDMAISSATNTIWVRPDSVKGNGNTPEEIEDHLVRQTRILAEHLQMTEESIREMITSDRKLLRIAKYVDMDVANRIREEKLAGIEITEDVKRYYPMDAFACHVLGGTTDDNYGLAGIELAYNRYLAGIDGRWITNKDNTGNSLSYGTERYYQPRDGYSVILTLDAGIQHIVETALVQAQERTKAARVMCMIMDPKSAEILAMAQTPEFDPNNPRTPLDPEEAARMQTLSPEEQMNYWNKMWRNFCISDTYEPGSTFKLITAGIVLDEAVTNLQETFVCTGTYPVADTVLKCWYYPRVHGRQTLEEAIQNSCNPVMIQLAQRVGLTAYYKGLDRFGLTEKTGVDFPGEGYNILQPKETAGPVGLATMAYGQGIAVTPVSLLTAVSAYANDGLLMKPRFVKALVDSEGQIVEEYEPEITRRSVSSQTASDMLSIMESVVTEGGGGTARVTGYRIGGKTGTANKPEAGGYSDTDVYGSFIGVAPLDDPQIAILVIVDSPRGVLYGSQTAAPAAKAIMQEVFRYLDIQPRYTEAEEEALKTGKTEVPDVVGERMSDAIGILGGQTLGFTVAPKTDLYEDLIVTDQYPRSGTLIDLNTKVTLYYE
ncbi:MAG: penicillin-binding transpeptidase domain-containing protein [Eubacteriales bacterium]|nr:penicillin-binding transpeptidase domain-containing protein [Eubacteriales bacterium]MDD4285367.1 penicillin-binding transpeptidase domain-containing protein [Eubacteriales bacterium]NLV70526.1 PASTA domain-containing protein [Clostridiales bacterium]HPF18880.1 penicillin-binding transpeptidase domain-containing protein [Bacillota bacterium]